MSAFPAAEGLGLATNDVPPYAALARRRAPPIPVPSVGREGRERNMGRGGTAQSAGRSSAPLAALFEEPSADSIPPCNHSFRNHLISGWPSSPTTNTLSVNKIGDIRVPPPVRGTLLTLLAIVHH